jgi:hypothetical protein
MAAPDTRTTIQAMQDALDAAPAGSAADILSGPMTGAERGRLEDFLAKEYPGADGENPSPHSPSPDGRSSERPMAGEGGAPAPDEGAAPDPATRIANFLEWCCTRGPDAGRTKAQTLHDAFTQWDALRGHAPVPISLFGHTLEDLGVRKHRISAGVHYLDIALNSTAKVAAQ